MTRPGRLKPAAAMRAAAARSPLSTCPTGKRQHRSQAAARKFARKAGSQGASSAGRYSYECSQCHCWHLTKLRPA